MIHTNTPPAHRGRLRIAGSTLADAMGLPAGTVIHAISSTFFDWPPAFELVVSHESLPLVTAGEVIPLVRLELTAAFVSPPRDSEKDA